MRTALILLILLVTFQVSAQEKFNETQQAWIDTGYGFDELFVEPDFTAENCMAGEKYFVGCMVVLTSLAESLKEDEKDQEIVLDEMGGFKLVAKPTPQQTLSAEAAKEEVKKKREMFAGWYALTTADDIKTIKSQVQALVEANFSEEMAILTSTTHYGLLLNLIYDPRTSFIPKALEASRPNKYEGIGSHVQKIDNEDSPLFGGVGLKPLVGSPAEAAGLQQGDVILAVDGESILEDDLSDVVDKIKGLADTQVTLTIHSICDQESKEVVVTRGGIVDVPDWKKDSRFVSLKSFETIEETCAGGQKELAANELQALYVPLHSFVAKSPKQLCEEFIGLQIRDLQNPASLGMIFDLRGNPGGYLAAVTCMLDSVISSDAPMLGQYPVSKGELVEGAETKITKKFSARGPLSANGNFYTYNKSIVVLVNGGSASASEVFSGAIQDMRRGWVIGNRTVGKGSVQTGRRHPRRLSLMQYGDQDLTVRETTAIYTLPSGRSPQQVGILPDFRVSELGEAIEDKEGDELTAEAGSLNSIAFGSEDWVQPRPEVVEAISSCTANSQSHSSRFKALLENDERYSRPFIRNYQMELAKDVLLCGGPRPEVL